MVRLFNRLLPRSLLLLAVLVFPTSCIKSFSGGQSACHHGEDALSCVHYVRNYDADTITFNIEGVHPLIGREINVRVAGVDTAEIRTKNACEKTAALASRDYVGRLLSGAKRIDLINIKRDKYFRIVADVQIDGRSLTQILLDQGFASPYDGGTKTKTDWCIINQTAPRQSP